MNPKQPIELIQPTSRSWYGMKRVLFQPFDISKWFVLGFTAWLAHLLESGGSGGGGGTQSEVDPENRGAEIEPVIEWVQENIEWVIGVGALLLAVVLAVVITLIWLRSRGKFMFLDNVVHNRALVKAPWYEFRELGNSLFRWNLAFGVIVFSIVAIIGGSMAVFVYSQLSSWSVSATLGVVAMSLVMMGFILLMSYVTLLLEDFVVPTMYKYRLTATEAWKKFLALHRQALGWFILYALWKMLLGIAVMIAVMALGVATCCIGFFILMIPYLGAVIMLPASVFFRFLGPEFLRQFGEEYDILSSSDDPDLAVRGF